MTILSPLERSRKSWQVSESDTREPPFATDGFGSSAAEVAIRPNLDGHCR